MKKFYLFTAVLMLVALTGCRKKTVIQQSQVLRVADIHSEGYPTIVGLREFARLVAERTNGRLQIEILTDGVAGDESVTLEMVQFGKLDFTRVSISPLSEIDKNFAVLVVPGEFRDENHFWNVLDGEIGEKCLKTLEKYGFYGMCYYDSGARSFYSSKKITSFDDLKGLKLRTQKSSVMIDFVNALGAEAVPMEYLKTGAAIKNGALDGAENNISVYKSTEHYKSAPYYFIDEHTRVADILVGSKKRLDLLSKEDRKLIYECAKASEAVQREAWKEYEEAALSQVMQEGVVIHKPTGKEREDALNTVIPVVCSSFTDDQLETLNKIKAIK